MADEAVSLSASDVLGLGGNWIPQNSQISTDFSYAEMLKSNGDYQKWSDTFDEIATVNIPYRFNADAGLGAGLPNIGSIHNGYHIDGYTIDTTHNEYPMVTFSAHQHGVNPHIDDRVEYALPAGLIALALGSLGAYDWAGLAADEVCGQSSTLTMSLNHIDENCDSDHWTGQNVQGVVECTVNYIGNITSFTVAGYTVTNYTINDSNEAFDTSSITFSDYLTRVA